MALTRAASARTIESSLVTERRLWSTLLAGRRSQEVEEGAAMSGERPESRATESAPQREEVAPPGSRGAKATPPESRGRWPHHQGAEG
jgi:hypothetical protein